MLVRYHVVEFVDTPRPRYAVLEYAVGQAPKVLEPVWTIRAMAEAQRDELVAEAESEALVREAQRFARIRALDPVA